MTPRSLMAVALAAFFAVAGLTGCATHQAATTAAEVSAEAAFEPFHDIVDMAFVEHHIAIPMADNVMLIDSRPYKPKYFQGHIPMVQDLRPELKNVYYVDGEMAIGKDGSFTLKKPN